MKLVKDISNKVNAAIVKVKVPLSEMFGYSTDVRTMSSGRASYVMEPASFEPIPQMIVDEIIKERGGRAA